jgi:hypothetical protein
METGEIRINRRWFDQSRERGMSVADRSVDPSEEWLLYEVFADH